MNPGAELSIVRRALLVVENTARNLAVPAANLAVLSAQAVDRELASAPPELIQAIRDLGEDFRLFRSIHRKLHLDQIEAVLKKSRATIQI